MTPKEMEEKAAALFRDRMDLKMKRWRGAVTF